MKKLKIILLKGLPASGKSTFAKTIAERDKYKVVNKDSLREMLDSGKWSSKNEKFILEIRDKIIKDSLLSGYNVVVDDTNLHEKHEKRMKEIIESLKDNEIKVGLEINDVFMDVPIQECIERDLKRPNSVGEKVIRGMYNQFIKENREIKKDLSLTKAIICDIDGTLAKKGDRSPYDWKKVGKDSVNTTVALVVDRLRKANHKIIITTGRDGSCEKETKDWLAKNYIFYDDFYMREEGNTEKDSIIKERFYRDHIVKKYNVVLAIDDRTQVVEMWRDIGLECWQVANGDF